VISRATRSFWDAYEELNAAQKAYRLFEENTVCGDAPGWTALVA